ncbi:hypothetical protein SPBR_08659 [Sporothrix brasiliensis 5110]|uniref:Uncharacterized protein n=1 Tax=Sporothrix brasiliensis 5110 TaxID=1398154 RepID=A0A0C2IIA4_9PEZI|nr:uncharacterized protein SPBR_08659 [Sporothrix brasiliensis 5110]KIH86695.1 hypothetical protein SPBR_08659 [Sporothrix brasiliensis 5110]
MAAAVQDGLLLGSSGGLAGGQQLVDPQTDQTDTDDEDDGEHNNDTSLAAGPVGTLGNVGDSLLARSECDGTDGGHCDCVVW